MPVGTAEEEEEAEAEASNLENQSGNMTSLRSWRRSGMSKSEDQRM